MGDWLMVSRSPSPPSNSPKGLTIMTLEATTPTDAPVATPPRRDIRKHRQLRVPVLQTEADAIRKSAAAAGLPVAAYLRNVGLGVEVRSVLAHKRVEELATLNADLGRLGGLLRLWLEDDIRARQFEPTTIRALLSKIEQNQTRMVEVMRTVVLPRS